MENGKKNHVDQLLKQKIARIVDRIAPMYVIFHYAGQAEVVKAEQLAPLLTALMLDFPEAAQQSPETLRLVALKRLYQAQAARHDLSSSSFSDEAVPFFYRLDLPKRWVYLAFFHPSCKLGVDQFSYMTEMEQEETLAQLWALVGLAKHYFAVPCPPNLCRQWPFVLHSVVGKSVSEVDDEAIAHLEVCQDCAKARDAYREILDLLHKLVPLPPIEESLKLKVRALIEESLMPTKPGWGQRLVKELYRRGIVQDKPLN